MNREDVDKLRLGKATTFDVSWPRKPSEMAVDGLPSHLHADIFGTDQSGYRYRLTREGDGHGHVYTREDQSSRTPEEALQELKKLLNWDPV